MMKKKGLLWLLVGFLLLFTACGVSSGPQGEIPTVEAEDGFVDEDTFWILTVKTDYDQMEYQVRNAVQYIRKQYPDLDIKVEYLNPENYKDLDLRLTQIRVDIMSGKGPDVFIFPTERSLGMAGAGTAGIVVYPNMGGTSETLLFPDVNQAIQSGHFLDISEQYDADTELGKEGLNTTIMDAGLYEGMRVLLPLRYDLPVYVVDVERFAQTGKDLEWLANTDAVTMMNEVIALNDQRLVGSAYPCLLSRGHMLSYFHDRFDYGSDNIDLTVEELAAFLEKADTVRDMGLVENLIEFKFGTTILSYVSVGFFLGNLTTTVQQMLLQEAMDVALICKTTGTDYAMVPCRMADGSVVAHVTWYGAVGSGCNDTDLAYEFLRMFLSEEYQWELSRPEEETYGENHESTGMIAEGFPVRDRGAAEHVCKTGLRDIKGYLLNSSSENRLLVGTFWNYSLGDSDLPFLDFEIDEVRFPLSTERSYRENICNGYDENHQKLYESTTEMAEEIMKQLRYQLAEG